MSWRYIDFEANEVPPSNAFARVHSDGRKQVKAIVRFWIPFVFVRRIERGFSVQFGFKPLELGRRWMSWKKARSRFWAISLTDRMG